METALVHDFTLLTCIRLGKQDPIFKGDNVVPNVQLLVMMIFAKFFHTADTWSCIISHSSHTRPSHYPSSHPLILPSILLTHLSRRTSRRQSFHSPLPTN